MLHQVNKDTEERGYCGPFAVASVTGEPLSKVIAAFKLVQHGPHWTRRKKTFKVVGTSSWQLIKVLKHLGYKASVAEVTNKEPPTLKKWAETLIGAKGEKTFIVSSNWHWVAVEGGRLCHSGTSGEVIALDKFPNQRMRIVCVVEVGKKRSEKRRYIPQKK